jgi:hypothetical protein
MRRFFSFLGSLSNIKVDPGGQPMLLVDTSLPNPTLGQWIGPELKEGTDALTSDNSERSEFARAEERFRSELPDLLEAPGKLGKWVLYSSTGRVEDVADDENNFYLKYGKQIGKKYFLGRIQPDPPQAEVTANWFVTVEDGRPSGGSKRGR